MTVLGNYSAERMKTQAALALCVTDLAVLCVDAKADAADLSGFASLIQVSKQCSKAVCCDQLTRFKL